LLLVFLLAGCRPWRKPNTQLYQRPKIKHAKLYILHVEGIECKQCVLSALYALKIIKQIKHVDCLCPKKQYEHARFECFIKKSKRDSLPIEIIRTNLAKEDFQLESIEGEFSGTLVIDDNKLQFVIQDLPRLNLIGSDEILSKFKERIKNKKSIPIQLYGKIDFDEKRIYIT